MRVLPYHIPFVAERGERFPHLRCGRQRIHRPEHGVWAAAVRAPHPATGGRGRHPADHRIRQPIGLPDRNQRSGPPGSSNSCSLSMELLRFANSGTEALRLGRPPGPHLHRPQEAGDVRRALPRLERSGVHPLSWSPLAELPAEGFATAIPGTTGRVDGILDQVIVVPVERPGRAGTAAWPAYVNEVAGVMMEPIMGNAGVTRPCRMKATCGDTVREMTPRPRLLC